MFSLITTTLGSVGLFALAVQIVASAIQYFFNNMMRVELANLPNSSDPAAGLAIFKSIWYWGTMASSTLLGSLEISGSMHGMIKKAWGQTTSFADCVTFGLSRLVPALAVYILWFLGVGFASMLLFIPGMILMTMWSAAMPALVGEETGVTESFGRSRALTRGSRWQIFFTIVIVLVVIYGVFFGAMAAIFGGGIEKFGAAMNASPWMILVSIPTGWIFASLLNALLASIYVEMVSIKEGAPRDQLSGVFN